MQLTGILIAASALVAGVNAQHALTAWSGTNFGGRSYRTGSRGTYNLGFYARSYRYTSEEGDGCCVKTCDNRRQTGYFCPSRENRNVASNNRFNKVVAGCGENTVLNC